MSLRELHLFAGIGGGILGGHLLGHRCVGAVEIDPYCRRVLADRFPNMPLHDDIRTFAGLNWRGKVDVVCGGFPCQPWSHAGKRLGTDDPRHLWPEMARVIQEIQPRYVFAENVQIKAFEEPWRDLRAMGYRVPPALQIGASDVGAPHRRLRWWLLAERSDTHGEGRLQQGRSDSEVRGRAAHLGETLSVPGSAGLPLPQEEVLRGTWGREEGRATAECGWWSAEPDMGRMAYGVPNRVGWLKALGNAQVPRVAATAFQILKERLG